MVGGCAPIPEAATGSYPETLRLLGTEPFWSAVIASSALTWTEPGMERDGLKAPVILSRLGPDLSISGRLDGRSFQATVTPGPCSDGMSDRSYPYSARVIWGERLFTGCAASAP